MPCSRPAFSLSSRLFASRQGQAPTPLAKADGVAELGAYLDGTWDLETARAATIRKVRRYAKRQRTFFRGQLAGSLAPSTMIADAASAPELAEGLLARLEQSRGADRPG